MTPTEQYDAMLAAMTPERRELVEIAEKTADMLDMDLSWWPPGTPSKFKGRPFWIVFYKGSVIAGTLFASERIEDMHE